MTGFTKFDNAVLEKLIISDFTKRQLKILLLSSASRPATTRPLPSCACATLATPASRPIASGAS